MTTHFPRCKVSFKTQQGDTIVCVEAGSCKHYHTLCKKIVDDLFKSPLVLSCTLSISITLHTLGPYISARCIFGTDYKAVNWTSHLGSYTTKRAPELQTSRKYHAINSLRHEPLVQSCVKQLDAITVRWGSYNKASFGEYRIFNCVNVWLASHIVFTAGTAKTHFLMIKMAKTLVSKSEISCGRVVPVKHLEIQSSF